MLGEEAEVLLEVEHLGLEVWVAVAMQTSLELTALVEEAEAEVRA